MLGLRGTILPHYQVALCTQATVKRSCSRLASGNPLAHLKAGAPREGFLKAFCATGLS